MQVNSNNIWFYPNFKRYRMNAKRFHARIITNNVNTFDKLSAHNDSINLDFFYLCCRTQMDQAIQMKFGNLKVYDHVISLTGLTASFSSSKLTFWY